MKKQFVFTILAFFLLALPLYAKGQTEQSPKISGGFHYIVSKNKAYIVDYTGEAGNVIIPDTLGGKKVVGINNRRGEVIGQVSTMVKGHTVYAYYGAFQNKGLTSVTIPDSVTIIENDAFKDNQLASVSIGKNVSSIGSGAFADNLLTSVVIPNSVTTIEFSAFENNRLTSITLGSRVASIGQNAFAGNPLTNISLASGNSSFTTKDSYLLSSDGKKIMLYYGGQRDIVIPDYVTAIAEFAFATNSLTSVIIPDSVTEIETSAFAGSKLTSVVIPDSVFTIGNSAFAENSLTNVAIGGGVKTIEDRAFVNNSISSVTIGNIAIGESPTADFRGNTVSQSAMSIGLDAFSGNPLADITIGSNIYLRAGSFENGFVTFYNEQGRRGGTFAFNTDSQSWGRIN